jgi:hypothetical protein
MAGPLSEVQSAVMKGNNVKKYECFELLKRELWQQAVFWLQAAIGISIVLLLT